MQFARAPIALPKNQKPKNQKCTYEREQRIRSRCDLICFVLILFIFLFQFSAKTVAVQCHLSSLFFFRFFTVLLYLLLLSTKPYYWCVRACVLLLDYLCLLFALYKFSFDSLRIWIDICVCLTICHFDECVKLNVLSFFWFRIA